MSTFLREAALPTLWEFGRNYQTMFDQLTKQSFEDPQLQVHSQRSQKVKERWEIRKGGKTYVKLRHHQSYPAKKIRRSCSAYLLLNAASVCLPVSPPNTLTKVPLRSQAPCPISPCSVSSLSVIVVHSCPLRSIQLLKAPELGHWQGASANELAM